MNNLIDYKSIKFRITVFIVGSVFVIFNMFIFFTTERNEQMLVESAHKRIFNEAERFVFEVKSLTENYLNATRSFANTLSAVKSPQSPVSLSRDQVISLMTNLLYDHSSYNSIGVVWEPNAFDMRDQDFVNQLYHDATGNFIPMIRRGANSSIIVEPDTKAYLQPYYLAPKQSKKSFVGSPNLVAEKNQKKLEVPFASVINYRGIFYGVVRFNIDISEIVTKTQELEILDGAAEVELISSTGNIIAASNSLETINIALKDLMESPTEITKLLATESYTFEKKGDLITTVHPVSIQGTSNKWFVRIKVLESDIVRQTNDMRMLWFTLNLLMFLASTLVVAFVVTYLLRPLKPLANLVDSLAQGDLEPETKFRTSGTELKELHSALVKLARSLAYNAKFAIEIGKGNLELPYSPVSGKDKLGNALLEMQRNLKTTKVEEDSRKEKEQIRSWTNDGIAELNQVVRQVPEKVADLTNAVLSFLVKYLSMNQGAFYVFNDEGEEEFFELSAAYAYNRERLVEKTIEPKDGLIHACIKEEKTIYLKEIPENYLKITSGTGEATPSFLIITPLMHGSSVLGVIELASFNELESYEIKLVEMTASAIAAEIASIKVKENTNKLLEESRSLSAKMANDETKLRKRLDELEEQQQEDAVSFSKLTSYLDAVKDSVFIIEYDTEGIIRDLNPAMVEYVDISKEELVGRPHKYTLQEEKFNEEVYESFWEDLRNGQTKHRISRYKLKEKFFWFAESFTQVFEKKGVVEKIVNIAVDITDLKEQQILFEQQNASLKEHERELEESVKTLTLYREQVHHTQNQLSSVIQVVDPIVCLSEFNFEGVIRSINTAFENTYNILKTETIGSHVRDILHFGFKEYEQIISVVSQGNIHTRESKIFSEKENIWLSEYFTPVKDSKGELVKIWYVAFDITESKNEMLRSQKRLERTLEVGKKYRELYREGVQNIRELTAKAIQQAVYFKALDNIITLARYSADGKLLDYNERLRWFVKKDAKELAGIAFNHIVSLPEGFDNDLFWMDVQSEPVEVETLLLLTEKEVWLSEVYYPIFEDDTLVQVISVGIEITPMKRSFFENSANKIKLENLTSQIKRIKDAEIEMKRELEQQSFFNENYRNAFAEIAALSEFNSDGNLMFADKKSKEIYQGLNFNEAHLSDFINFDTFDEYNALWGELNKGTPSRRKFLKSADENYLQHHIPVLKDGRLVKLLLISWVD